MRRAYLHTIIIIIAIFVRIIANNMYLILELNRIETKAADDILLLLL